MLILNSWERERERERERESTLVVGSWHEIYCKEKIQGKNLESIFLKFTVNFIQRKNLESKNFYHWKKHEPRVLRWSSTSDDSIKGLQCQIGNTQHYNKSPPQHTLGVLVVSYGVRAFRPIEQLIHIPRVHMRRITFYVARYAPRHLDRRSSQGTPRGTWLGLLSAGCCK